MSISERAAERRELFLFLGAAAFCVLFGCVYALFSHGVYSAWLRLLFLFPLLGGALPALALLVLPGARRPSRAADDAWRSAVATLSLGSCLTGVFEVYGSSSTLVYAYWAAGLLLAAGAVFLYARQYARG